MYRGYKARQLYAKILLASIDANNQMEMNQFKKDFEERQDQFKSPQREFVVDEAQNKNNQNEQKQAPLQL